ncbi:hypothetical protein T492DRAFT_1077254 [Pavlovales sp. CCMP2436]|nr:hypothetical protein T492DRAFT_1077254 [Pavlovales sp. CCMP2436]
MLSWHAWDAAGTSPGGLGACVAYLAVVVVRSSLEQSRCGVRGAASLPAESGSGEAGPVGWPRASSKTSRAGRSAGEGRGGARAWRGGTAAWIPRRAAVGSRACRVGAHFYSDGEPAQLSDGYYTALSNDDYNDHLTSTTTPAGAARTDICRPTSQRVDTGC